MTGHAGCYNHALATIARKNGVAVDSITTSAQLTMGTGNQGPDVRADLTGTTDAQFQQLADDARRLCSSSKILRVPEMHQKSVSLVVSECSPVGDDD